MAVIPEQISETVSAAQHHARQLLAVIGVGAAVSFGLVSTANGQEQVPGATTARLLKAHDPVFDTWASRETARCQAKPGFAEMATSWGNPPDHHGTNSLRLTRRGKHGLYILKLNAQTELCVSDGKTANNKMRRNMFRFYKKSNGMREYRFLDPEIINLGYATTLVEVDTTSRTS